MVITGDILSPSILGFAALMALACLAALYYRLGIGRAWRLRRVIRSGDGERIESARDAVTPPTVPTLMRWYWRTRDWAQKQAIVTLLQDQAHPHLRDLMLDFLRVPVTAGDKETELAQAVALGFIDEKYDRFMTYYHDRELLARDVSTVLRLHGLQAEPPPAPQPVPQVRPAINIPDTLPPNDRLLRGILADDLSTVRWALRDGAAINVVITGKNYNGCSALLLAMLLARFEIARFLIQEGADIHFTRANLQGRFIPQRGQTALWWAATHCHLPLAEELLRRGANVNTPDHHGGTPLTQAASCGHLEMVRYLVSQGADIHARISDGRKALNLAVTHGRLEVAAYLIEAGNSPDERCGNGFTPLMVAALENHYDLADFLIKQGADVNATHLGVGNYIAMRDWTPLCFAVSAGLVRLTRLLLNAGADVHYRVPAGQMWDGTPLPERGMADLISNRRGKESILKMLQERGL